MKKLQEWFSSRFSPLGQLLIIGFIPRLCSVIFSRGFGWHDDHFLIIEASQSWVDGYDYNNWLPSPDAPERQPSGHSLFYTGLHYFLFKLLTSIGISDPQSKMVVVRFLHALWSLLIIKYGYLIAERQGGKKTAWYTGLFLALYWFMPFISVRNLVEFVCVPPILIAIWLCSVPNARLRDYLLAGMWLGIAFSIRFQSVFISAGIGLALVLMRRRFTQVLTLGLGALLVVLLTQGLIDFLIWKRPFAEFWGYVDYNLHNADQYGTNNWHMYFDLIFGLLIPPLSIALFAGYIANWRRDPLIFWPVLFYLVFHMYFPNKQERFVMTILPLIIISGSCGAIDIYRRFPRLVRRKVFKAMKVFVIALNLILLPVLTVSYSKRHRCEAMYYLNKNCASAEFIVEDSNHDDFLMPPQFYYGKWISVRGVTRNVPMSEVIEYYKVNTQRRAPEYVIFWESENLVARMDTVRKYFPAMSYETTIQPSFIDKTLYWLNPLNSNQTTYIYRLGKMKKPAIE